MRPDAERQEQLTFLQADKLFSATSQIDHRVTKGGMRYEDVNRAIFGVSGSKWRTSRGAGCGLGAPSPPPPPGDGAGSFRATSVKVGLLQRTDRLSYCISGPVPDGHVYFIHSAIGLLLNPAHCSWATPEDVVALPCGPRTKRRRNQERVKQKLDETQVADIRRRSAAGELQQALRGILG
jgi:hypothetical protein